MYITFIIHNVFLFLTKILAVNKEFNFLLWLYKLYFAKDYHPVCSFRILLFNLIGSRNRRIILIVQICVLTLRYCITRN